MIFSEEQRAYLQSFLSEGKVPRHVVKLNYAILKRSGLADEHSPHSLGQMAEVQALLDLLTDGYRGKALSKALRFQQRMAKDDHPSVALNFGKLADAVDSMS